MISYNGKDRKAYDKAYGLGDLHHQWRKRKREELKMKKRGKTNRAYNWGASLLK